MNEKPVERRLAAVLAADVVGYSRLMGADELGTLRALKAHRRELIDPTIAEFHGRIVKTTGDGALVEFPSAVDAVTCAIIIQREVASRNSTVPEEKRLTFRVGINVGDIIIDAKDIFGDGVNVAARLQALCEPGGLCISQGVHEQVRDRIPIAFDDHGEQFVKNIARPVRVFSLGPRAVAAASDLAPGERASLWERRRGRIAAVLAAFALLGGAGAWWAVREHTTTVQQASSTVSAAAPAAASRASIAVLPLASLGDPGAGDYFADGLTEDIISALGRFREMSVISRSGVSAYKGRNPTPEEIGRDLKVRYVVEGSVRRSPERIRVSVSLTDAVRGTLLWSERYDAEPKDIFAVQDEITRQVAGALAVRVTGLELANAAAKPPNNLEAYDLVLRGRDLLSRGVRSANAQARSLFERAIELDPRYAPAYVGLGKVNFFAGVQGWAADGPEALERAEGLARKAIALDGTSPSAHALLGGVALYFGDYDRALGELMRAIELNGSDAESYSGVLSVLLYRGDLAGAIAAGELLSQFQPNLSAIEAFHLAIAYVLAHRSADAIRVLESARDRNRWNRYAQVILAAAYAEAGRPDDAARQAEIARRLFPGFSRDEFGALLRNPAHRASVALAIEKSGL
jgi:adenylate cyclase